jgi:hypothetical protein
MMFLFFTLSGLAMPPADSPAPPITGKVLETKNVSTYTYLRLKIQTEEIWAAVPLTTIAVGAQVTLANPLEMKNFESKTLKKKFDRIIFGNLAAGTEIKNEQMGHPRPMVNPAREMEVKTPDLKSAKLTKAEGSEGRTVAEVFAQKKSLNGKTVLVRGKVTKVAPGIMGRNWIHLSDGTGTITEKNFDLAITSQELPQTGDVVLAKGIVAADKDFGSGYFYAAIVEQATFTK